MPENNLPFKQFAVTSKNALIKLEDEYRSTFETFELFPYAKNSSYVELSEIIPDNDGEWVNPLTLAIFAVSTEFGRKIACQKVKDYIDSVSSDTDFLSISAAVYSESIQVTALIRVYGSKFNAAGFFEYIDDPIQEIPEEPEQKICGNLIIPDEVQSFVVTDEMQKTHNNKISYQQEIFEQASEEKPFLNRLEEYEPNHIKNPAESMDLIYDLKTTDMMIKLNGSYEDFNRAFKNIMRYVNGTERYSYFDTLELGKQSYQKFMDVIKKYAYENIVKVGDLAMEDLPALLSKVYRALYQMYILQDLINDPQVTDIKITDWDAIRCRVRGNAYITNLTFVDRDDYERFIKGIIIRNNISENVPIQTFTDTGDDDYILRFSLINGYVTSTDVPCLHIRKIWRKKLLLDDLVERNMLEPKVKEYLLDCCKNSRGIVIAGGPGSGKTVLLNALLEEGYEQSAEILVIQENDELFTYRKGVIFEHIINNKPGYPNVSLEELGSLALVAGANVFVIGEAKGAEICSAITLSNSGCRTAITIHSNSSTEIVNKMADLAQRGYAKDAVAAKRMLASFQTLVFLKNFKVQEISEIEKFDEEKQDMIYKCIYKRV